MSIQSAHYHRMMNFSVQRNLLPLCFSGTYGEEQKKLDFYSYGYVKEKISRKIVSSFEICDPCFFTALRDDCFAMREKVYDDLFTSYLDKPICDKGKFINLFITECGIAMRRSKNSDDSKILLFLQSFIINCVFVAGLNKFYHSSEFDISKPDRQLNRDNGTIWDFRLPDIFRSGSSIPTEA